MSDDVLERKKVNLGRMAKAYTQALKDGSIIKFKFTIGSTKVNYNYGGITEVKK